MNRELIEQQLSALPLAQYGWIETAELEFSERIRRVCEQECPMYGKTWACPPAVGTVEECRARCLSYPHALYLTTLTEVSDIANLEETLATRAPHEAVTREANCTRIWCVRPVCRCTRMSVPSAPDANVS